MKQLIQVFVLLLVFAVRATHAGEAQPGSQSEWKKLVELAKKEGQVTIYTGVGVSPEIGGVFQKIFPEIKVVRVTTADQVRVLSEQRAGKYLADIAVGGLTTFWQLYSAKALEPIKDIMILPEVTDESRWWGGKHRYIDPERKYAFVYIGNPEFGLISYNTKLVNPNELRSLWDFLHPKWKGKIAARDIRSPGAGTTSLKIFYYLPKVGPDFIRRLFGEMDITLFRDARQGVDWLATGKYPICFFCNRTGLGRAKSQGLPVEEFGPMKEGGGLSSGGGIVGLVRRAPHPNAARLFINWFLSREGQIALQMDYAKLSALANSLRVDIPKDVIPREMRLTAGVHYIDVDIPERMSMEPMVKIVNEALAQAGK